MIPIKKSLRGYDSRKIIKFSIIKLIKNIIVYDKRKRFRNQG